MQFEFEADGKMPEPKTFRRVFRQIFHYPLFLSSGIVLILLGTGAALLEPRLFGYAIDDAITPKNWALLKRIALLFLVTDCVRVSSLIGHGYLFEKLGQYVLQDLRIGVMSKLQSIPVSIYDKTPVGKMITRVTNDVSAMAEMFSAGFIVMIGNFLAIVGTVASLLAMDVRLGLASIAIFPVLITASIYFSRRLKIAYRDTRARLSALNAFLAENILGMKIVHLFNRQPLHEARFQAVNQSYADAQISSIRVFAYFQPTITWCSAVSLSLLIFYGGRRAGMGHLPLGILVADFSYALSLFQPMRELADKWNIFLSGMTAAERVFAIMDWESELSEAELDGMPRALDSVRGEIRFENVWFAYQGEQWVLRDFSLTIAPGMRVGIVGHTGAGKSTLINLLMRFYQPQRGRILLDGKDLREYDKRSLRAMIGLIQQDVFLFSGSSADNIALWREARESDLNAILQAVKDMGLPMHELQERGNNLSAGERQVLAFARAAAANPRIWILDEATAQVDSDSERKLGNLLGTFGHGKTVLMIAHRLATVKDADLIVVLHDGALQEKGSHAELVARQGIYARLYRYQAALDRGPAPMVLA